MNNQQEAERIKTKMKEGKENIKKYQNEKVQLQKNIGTNKIELDEVKNENEEFESSIAYLREKN